MRVPHAPRNVLRLIGFVASLLTSVVTGSLSGQTLSPSPIDGFDPSANGIVSTSLLQSDGKIIIAGYFTSLQPNGASSPTAANYIARLNTDGTLDTTFTNAGVNAQINSIALTSSGQILIGGTFTKVGSATRSGVARLNADGSLDTSFAPVLTGHYGVQIYAVASQTDGKVLVGGAFTTANGVARNYVARFNSNGTLDTTFDPNANLNVMAIAVQSNGQIILGGTFTTLKPNGASSTTTRSYIARVNADGTLDSSFDPEANSTVTQALVQSNGQILLAGAFTTFQPNGATGSTQCDFFARLNSDGTLDGSYILNPNNKVTGLALQSDGKLIITGLFTSVYPVNATASVGAAYIARINTDGSVDSTFRPNPNFNVSTAAVQSNGQIVIGGYFTSLQPNDAPATTSRNYIARLNTDGSLDASMAPDSIGRIVTSATQSDGKILIGGTFTSIGGKTANYIARIDGTTGALDTSFNPNVNSVVSSIAVQSNGQILIGGTFTTVNNTTRNYIARLNADGSLDTSYDPNASGAVYAIAIQSADGKAVIGGAFTSVTPNGATTATQQLYIGRLNTDGTLDTNFEPQAGGVVNAIAFQSDGSIIIGGQFTSITSWGDNFASPRNYVAKLGSDGKLDEKTFNPSANAPVYAIAVQSDNKIIIGGAFTTLTPPVPNETVTTVLTPTTRNYIARLNSDGSLDTSYNPSASSTVLGLAVQSNNQVIAVGNFTSFEPNGATSGTIRNYLARINTDGTLDSSFTPGANAQIGSVAVQSSGKILLGGIFSTITPQGGKATARSHFARLNTDGTLDTGMVLGTLASSGGSVGSLAVLPTGQILVGGSFATLGGSTSTNLARFSAAGFPDTTFNPNPDGQVNAIGVPANGSAIATASSYGVWLNSDGSIRTTFPSSVNGQVNGFAKQADGKILIAGLFSSFGGSPSPNLARFNADGTPDTTFNPNVVGQVLAVAVQPSDQKIIIAGDFVSVGSTTETYLARLNPDGSVDTTYVPTPSAEVRTLYIQPADGKCIIGGTFSTLQPNGASATTTREDIARLNTDGTIDTSFNPNPNGPIYSIVPQSDGKFILTGGFTSLQPNGTGSNVAISYIARINSDGTLDTGFNPFANGLVYSAALQSDGKIVIGGLFTTLQPNNSGTIYTRDYLARLNSDGSVDTSWATSANLAVQSVVMLSGNQVLVGGNFTTLQPINTTSVTTRNYIARLNSDGTVDSSFDPDPNGAVQAILPYGDGSLLVGGTFTSLQPNGAILIGGSFANVAGQAAANLSRISMDGAVDTGYLPNPNGAVNTISFQGDGKAIVGGSFTQVKGTAQPYLARLTTSGTVDTTYSAQPNGIVYASALQADGKTVIGGAFTQVNGVAANHIARLTTTGALDTSFTGTANDVVSALAVLANGQILAAGPFTSIGGTSTSYLARLNASGSVDTSFTPNPNGAVSGVAIQADGSIVVGGSFTSIAGASRAHTARLHADGSIDTAFAADTDGTVNAVAVQADGKPLFGGTFTTLGGQSRSLFGRLSASSSATQSLAISSDLKTITWTRGGSSPDLAAVLFEESSDGNTWSSVGQASRVASTATWTLANAAPNASSSFFVRARGVSPSSRYGSAGLIQSIQAFTVGVNTSGASSNIVTALAKPFALTVTSGSGSYTASNLPTGLSINAATGIISGVPVQAGVYPVTVSSDSSASSFVITVNSAPATLAPLSRIPAITSQALLHGSDTLQTSFTVSGSGQTPVFAVGAGPALASFGVSSGISAPSMSLVDGSGNVVQANAGAGANLTALSALASDLGAIPITATDAAISATVGTGTYATAVADLSGQGGLVESQLINASSTYLVDPTWISSHTTRATVYPGGSGTVVVAFNVGGAEPVRLLIRGVGPGLAAQGVSNALSDPSLALYDSHGNLIAQNTGWGTQTALTGVQVSSKASDVAYAASEAGASPLASGSGDDAMVVTLEPGTYSIQITSLTGGSGTVSAEVYQY